MHSDTATLTLKNTLKEAISLSSKLSVDVDGKNIHLRRKIRQREFMIAIRFPDFPRKITS